MKQLTLMGMLLIMATMSHAQIDFQKFNWDKLTKQAASEDKLIVVDMTATWCYWCKVMDKKVFSKKKVGDYYNANFVSTKLYDTHEMGGKFASKYSVGGFPTLLFLNSEGELVHKIEGAIVDVNDFLSESEKALKNKGTVMNTGGNEDETPTAESLAAELLESAEYGEVLEEEYAEFLGLKGNKDSDLERETTWMLAMMGQAPAAREIVARRASFSKEYGKDEVNEALMGASMMEALEASADLEPEDAQFVNKLQKKSEVVFRKYFDEPDYIQAGVNMVVFGLCMEYELQEQAVSSLHDFIPSIITFAKSEEEVAEVYLGGAEMMLELSEHTSEKDLKQGVLWAEKAAAYDKFEIHSYEIIAELYEEMGNDKKAEEFRNKAMQD